MHKSSSEFWQVIQSAVNNGSAGLPRDLGSFHPRQRWQDQGNKKTRVLAMAWESPSNVLTCVDVIPDLEEKLARVSRAEIELFERDLVGHSIDTSDLSTSWMK